MKELCSILKYSIQKNFFKSLKKIMIQMTFFKNTTFSHFLVFIFLFGYDF